MKMWVFVSIFLFSFNVFAQACDYENILDNSTYPGRTFSSSEDINPFLFITEFNETESKECVCEFYNYLNKFYPLSKKLSRDMKKQYRELKTTCSIYKTARAQCRTLPWLFNLRLSWIKPQEDAIQSFNKTSNELIEALPLDMKEGDEVCHRHPDNVFGIIIHHTASIYLSKHNLESYDYRQHITNAFDLETLSRVRNSESGTNLLEDFTSNDPKSYVKILHQEFQNGMQEWSGIPYHYLVTYDSSKESWTTVEGRPVTLVGAHAGIARPMSTYPRTKYPDPSWRRRSMNQFSKDKNIKIHPKTCITDNLLNEQPLLDNWNDFSIGIVVKGHFAKISGNIDPLNPTVYQAAYKGGLEEHLAKLVLELKKKFPNVAKVIRHSDVSQTACPGTLGGKVTNHGHTSSSDRGITGRLDKLMRSK